MKPEKKCARLYEKLNKRFFNGGLPTDVEFKVIEDWSQGRDIDTRHDMACVNEKVGGGFLIEVNAGIVDFPKVLTQVIAHEAIHLRIGLAKDHKSKEWKSEVRRITGLGFFLSGVF